MLRYHFGEYYRLWYRLHVHKYVYYVHMNLYKMKIPGPSELIKKAYIYMAKSPLTNREITFATGIKQTA